MRLLAVAREIQWRIFDWQLGAESRAKSIPAEEISARRCVKLRSLLTRTPYWAAGHLHLAAESFLANNLPLAFVSTQAVIALEPDGPRADAANSMRARCLLKYGAAAEARQIIERLLLDAPDSAVLREDLAAIFMVEGKFPAAVAELEKIPPAKLSAEGTTALEFARSKAAASSAS